MTAIYVYLSTIILNTNGLNLPIKRHREVEWIKKQKLSMCLLSRTHLALKIETTLK